MANRVRIRAFLPTLSYEVIDEVEVGSPEVYRFLDLRLERNPFLLCNVHALLQRGELGALHPRLTGYPRKQAVKTLTSKAAIYYLLLSQSSTMSEFFMHASNPLRNSSLF